MTLTKLQWLEYIYAPKYIYDNKLCDKQHK